MIIKLLIQWLDKVKWSFRNSNRLSWKTIRKNNVDTKDINEILVGRGPGSYTGVRISGTIAKVLALVRNCKLYSFSTLDLLLCHKVGTSGTYIARIVAKKTIVTIKSQL